jgi:hypothetical protein
MDSVSAWLKTNAKRKIGALVFGLAALVACVHAINSVRTDAIDRTRERLFMDSQTGKTFMVELKAGMSIPVISPDTGQATGYPPEECYWNADGTTKTTPTYVILNSYLGKPGPTFCPDCGRLVVPRNPPPIPGRPPPPTRAEYEQRYHN